jgi:hypothetical protein
MMTTLGTVSEVSTGYPFRKKIESEPDGDLVVVQIKDLGGSEGLGGAGAIVLRGRGGEYDRYLLRPGDVLFQSRGSRHPAVVVEAGLRGIAAMGLHVIRPDPTRTLPEYVAWWLNHPRSQAKFTDELARGSNVPFVAKADLEKFSVSIPPLRVQQQIVEIDALRARQEALSRRIDILWNDYAVAATWHAAISS